MVGTSKITLTRIYVLLELTAFPINELWSSRKLIRNRATRSQYQYDADFNLVMREQNGAGNIQLFMLEADNFPCAQLEQLIRHMSRDTHQSVLVLHIALQGMFK